MTVAWVIGGGGLLGSALCNVLRRSEIALFSPSERFDWSCEQKLNAQLELAVKAFAAAVGIVNNWHIYWAAGVGTLGSKTEELDYETRILSKLISLVKSQQELITTTGCFAFASSAGAIYAGATNDIITEDTPVAPTTAYAQSKLKQESLLSELARSSAMTTVLCGRISTLYGPGQAIGKRQGLLAEIARRIIRNQIIQIYVPFDTIRDYLNADDAAAKIVSATCATQGKSGFFIKIIASEQATTIAEIISIFKKVARRPPRIVTSANKLTGIYSRRIQFHSVFDLSNKEIALTSLTVGIALVMAAERSAFAQSRA